MGVGVKVPQRAGDSRKGSPTVWWDFVRGKKCAKERGPVLLAGKVKKREKVRGRDGAVRHPRAGAECKRHNAGRESYQT